MFWTSVLPCPEAPPLPMAGGWSWYGIQSTQYKCPNGHQFINNAYPYWYSNCTLQKIWDPPAVQDCKPRTCEGPIPDHFLGMDVIWPNSKSRDLGTTITYNCPFRMSTLEERNTGTYPCWNINLISCWHIIWKIPHSSSILHLHLG